MGLRLPSMLAISILLLTGSAWAGPPAYEKLKQQAERQFANKSYKQARALYARAEKLELVPADARWVDFRLADCAWRALAAADSRDSDKLNQAKQALEKLIGEVKREVERDRVWAEAQESLGDYHWLPSRSRYWWQAWQHYNNALTWWAQAADIELARERYQVIVFKAADPPWQKNNDYYGYHGNWVPVEVIENVIQITQQKGRRAQAYYLLAMTLRSRGGGYEQQARIPAAFEAALAQAEGTDWFDDALYHYAQHLENQGRLIARDDGGWDRKVDYPGALKLYRKLLATFDKGETRYYDDARSRIKYITEVSVGVGVSNVFIPGSEVQFHLNWRNTKKLALALYAVDLTRAVALTGGHSASSYLASIDLGKQERMRSWSKQTGDTGDHQPGSSTEVLPAKLPAGAYVIEVSTQGKKARELVLISDAAVVLKAVDRQAVAYVCDVHTGGPLAKAQVSAWLQRYQSGKRKWQRKTAVTGDDGLAVFTFDETTSSGDVFVAAKQGGRQAFVTGYANRPGTSDAWKVYAFTDRPAYRPEDEVAFKFLVRAQQQQGYSTPSGQLLHWRIDDARGSKVLEGKAALNAFGAAWGSLKLNKDMPLGQYRVHFWKGKNKNSVGSATLFRLEEYKLPEFQVSVKVPEQDGRPKIFRVGDEVEARIQVDYYFGGPVADAGVEVLVYQRPFYQYWAPPRDYPWLFTDMQSSRAQYWGGQGSVIKRESLKTDAAGQAKVVFKTPRGAGQDLEYSVEARVTDSSRREVVGSGSVRVTRQDFYVHAHPRHWVHRPGEFVEVDFRALDANGKGVVAKGLVTVTRDTWVQVWRDPDGKKVAGSELLRLQGKPGPFPPAPGWALVHQGYEHEQIATHKLRTDGQGKVRLRFEAPKEGYYSARWETPQRRGGTITASTSVWVASAATQELGYNHGGLQLLVDSDAAKVGQRLPVLILSPRPERWVLFAVEADGLYHHRLVHLNGTARRLDLPIERQHVPNVYLTALSVADRQVAQTSQQVVVPPVDQFLDVTVKTDKPVYRPRDKARLTVSTRDRQGKPVAAEVGLSLVDEAIFAIQSDYAGDPRKFFYGTKRGLSVQTRTSFQHRAYIKLVRAPDGAVIDERNLEQHMQRLREQRAQAEQQKSEERRLKDMDLALDDMAGAGMAEAEEVAAPMKSAVPASPVRSRRAKKEAKRDAGPAADQPAPGGSAAAVAEPEVTVRHDFRATALWRPDLKTGADGLARIEAAMPDSLTGWKATARAATAQDKVGIGTASARTRLPLLVRLQAPRFFVVGDQTTISAVVNNNTERALRVAVDLAAKGVVLRGGRKTKAGYQSPRRTVRVPAGGQARVDWRVVTRRPGTVELKTTARSGKLGDAMLKKYPAHPHGIQKALVRAGKLRGSQARIRLDLPKRRPGSTSLKVQLAPSLASTMLDALPYLIDYPYGCTEQTMSRFLPAVITARTLEGLGLEPAQVMGKAFGGIEAAHVDRTHPKGEKSLGELTAMTDQGLKRLLDFQHNDGGWGWWKKGESDRFMTAYVVWGLSLASEAGVKVPRQVLDRAVRFLNDNLVKEERSLDRQAWMLHALSVHHRLVKAKKVHRYQVKAFDKLWAGRDGLNAYSRALLTLAAVNYGKSKQARILVDNLAGQAERDEAPDTSVVMRGQSKGHASEAMGTARWGRTSGWWRWSDGAVETTAFVLRALLAVNPEHELVEPAMNWLVKNRRGAQWSNTRDTAIAVLALNDYLRLTGELEKEAAFSLEVNGRKVATKTLTGANLVAAPTVFDVDPGLLRDGKNEIVVRKRKGKALYFSALADFFSLEEPIAPAGNEIYVRRQYYRWAGRPSLLKGTVYERRPLNDGDTLVSGDRVEVVVSVESKNDYEYLVLEDLKPAGLEAVQLKSGQGATLRELKVAAVDESFGVEKNGRKPTWKPVLTSAGFEGRDYTGRSRWVHQEFRDRKVALFVDRLPQGVWEIRYELRAEVPGNFHGLPLSGHAMYVPEIRANGAEVRLQVVDR